MTKQYQHLSLEYYEILLSLLKISENMFDCTLGTRNSKPVNLELKDDAEPVCSHPYIVPTVHKVISRKYFLSTGKYWNSQTYKWFWMGSSVFCTNQMEETWVQFLRYFRHLNRKLKYKPYPMLKIRLMVLKQEGFKYATPLYFNMGYYNISLGKDSNNICTIVLPLG